MTACHSKMSTSRAMCRTVSCSAWQNCCPTSLPRRWTVLRNPGPAPPTSETLRSVSDATGLRRRRAESRHRGANQAVREQADRQAASRRPCRFAAAHADDPVAPVLARCDGSCCLLLVSVHELVHRRSFTAGELVEGAVPPAPSPPLRASHEVDEVPTARCSTDEAITVGPWHSRTSAAGGIT